MKCAVCLSLIVLLCFLSGVAQNVTGSGSASVIPNAINFSGTLTDANGNPLSGPISIRFSLYQNQTGGSALWAEMQNVQLDNNGQYSVRLGVTPGHELPADLFVSGQARWLGIEPQAQPKQPRVMLLSVPYALKAGDATTLGGLPPSAFVQAVPGGAGAVLPNELVEVPGNGGSVDPADQNQFGLGHAAQPNTSAAIPTPCHFANVAVLDPSCFSGSDIFTRINAAIASLPKTGGTVLVPARSDGTCYSGSTTIAVTKLVSIQGVGAGPTCLKYTGNGIAITANWGSSHYPEKLLYRIQLTGPGSGTLTTGVAIGSLRNTDQVTIEETHISGFGTNILFANDSYNGLLEKVTLTSAASCVVFSTINEETRIENSTFTGCGESLTFTNGTIDVTLVGNSFDDQSVAAWAIHAAGGGPCFNCNVEIFGFGNHFENQSGTTAQYISVNASGDGPRIFEYAGDINDYTTTGTNPQVILCSGCDTLVMDAVQVFSAGRRTNLVTVNGSPNVELKFANLSPLYITSNCVGCTGGRAAMMDIRTLGGAQVPWNFINVTLALAKGRLKLSDQGSCTMTSGACPQQQFATTYSSPPVCFGNWTGTGTLTGIISLPSTTSAITPRSTSTTDNAQIGWACFGN
jgi:hypothetical protein